MKNSKIGSVVKYTLEKNIKNKWFIGLNILFLVITVVALNFNTVKQILKSNNIEFDSTKVTIELVDNLNLLYDNLTNDINSLEFKDKIVLEKKDKVEYDEKTLDKNKIIVEVIEDETEGIKSKIISKEGIDTKYYNVILNTISKTKNNILATKYGLSESELSNITSAPQVERIMVGVDSSNSDIKTILTTLSNYLILIILMIVLSKIANDVSQEKISKSIEYVLTSISEKAYLISKVISINLTLIVQLVFGFVYFVIGMSLNSFLNLKFVNNIETLDSGSIMSNNILSLFDTNTIFYIILTFIFIILTVLILSVIQAAFSSKTTNITEAGNATILLVTLNLVIYVISTIMISPVKEANILMYILSCIPIISMYFVPSMVIVGQANIIQVVIAILLLIISVPFIFKICAKIFKNGVLDYREKRKNKKEKVKKDVLELQNEYIKKKEYNSFGFVIGMSVILFIVLQFVLSIVLSPFANVLSLGLNISTLNASNIITMIIFIISLLVPTLFVNMYTNKSDDKKDLKEGTKWLFIFLPIVAIIQLGLGYIFEKLGLGYDIIEKVNMYDSSSILSKVLFFIQIAVLPAIFEELYVRGAVFSFSKKYGKTFAIFASAILFSVIHLNITQSVFAFLMGILLSLLVVKSKSLIPSMLLHFINNGYEGALTIFENNAIAIFIINSIIVILIAVGVVVLLVNVFKNKVKIIDYINIVKEKLMKKEDNKNNINYNKYSISFGNTLKYIISDYSFIIALILVIVMMVLTQYMISIL